MRLIFSVIFFFYVLLFYFGNAIADSTPQQASAANNQLRRPKLRWHSLKNAEIAKSSHKRRLSEGRSRRAGHHHRILCANGTEVNGSCVCKQGFLGTHCEKKMFCNSYERHENGSCIGCKQHFTGERCEQPICENGGTENKYEQRCDCTPPFTGDFCDELTTANTYYFFNSKVSLLGPLGVLSVIPMMVIYYMCERAAKNRQVRRIEKIWNDQAQVSVNSTCIKDLLRTKK